MGRTVTHPEGIQDAVALRVAVARIHRALRSRARAQVTPSQVSALSRVEQGGPLRLGVLAQSENVSAATMSRVVEALEAAGLVERRTDEADARASLVAVTDQGREVLHELRSEGTRAIADALGALSDADRRRLAAALPVLETVCELLHAD